MNESEKICAKIAIENGYDEILTKGHADHICILRNKRGQIIHVTFAEIKTADFPILSTQQKQMQQIYKGIADGSVTVSYGVITPETANVFFHSIKEFMLEGDRSQLKCNGCAIIQGTISKIILEFQIAEYHKRTPLPDIQLMEKYLCVIKKYDLISQSKLAEEIGNVQRSRRFYEVIGSLLQDGYVEQIIKYNTFIRDKGKAWMAEQKINPSFKNAPTLYKFIKDLPSIITYQEPIKMEE